MHTMTIGVCYNPDDNTWSVEFAGRLYERVSEETMHDLFDYAMLVTRMLLSEPDYLPDAKRFNLDRWFADKVSA